MAEKPLQNQSVPGEKQSTIRLKEGRKEGSYVCCRYNVFVKAFCNRFFLPKVFLFTNPQFLASRQAAVRLHEYVGMYLHRRVPEESPLHMLYRYGLFELTEL